MLRSCHTPTHTQSQKPRDNCVFHCNTPKMNVHVHTRGPGYLGLFSCYSLNSSQEVCQLQHNNNGAPGTSWITQVEYTFKTYFKLRWDQFIIPKPFTKTMSYKVANKGFNAKDPDRNSPLLKKHTLPPCVHLKVLHYQKTNQQLLNYVEKTHHEVENILEKFTANVLTTLTNVQYRFYLKR